MDLHRRVPYDREVWKGVLAGLAGGLIASWTMNQFQAVWSKASQALSSKTNSGEQQRGDQQTAQQGNNEDATMKTANKLSQAILHRELSRDEKEKLGPVVHYMFGTIMGGLYGATAEVAPRVTTGFGAAFATALFLGVDEVAVPMLRLSGPPTDYPLSSHMYAFGSHLIYGVTTDGVRRGVRRFM